MVRKKAIACIVGLVMAFSLCACGDDDSSDRSSSKSTNKETSAEKDKKEKSDEPEVTEAESTPTPTSEAEETATPEPTVVSEPVVKNQYDIIDVLTPVSEDRTWVRYWADNEIQYALIDAEGHMILHFTKFPETAGNGVAATSFSDGVSCIHSTTTIEPNPGLWIVNKDGEFVFDSDEMPEGTTFYYLGYGNGIFLALQKTADFSSNIQYICEINAKGEIINQVELDDTFGNLIDTNDGYFDDDFEYFGDDVFAGTFYKNGNEIACAYNLKTHSLFGGIYIYDDFESGITAGGRDGLKETCDLIYTIKSDDLLNAESWQKWNDEGMKYLEADKTEDWKAYIGKYRVKRACISEGLINNWENPVYKDEMARGIYDYKGELVGQYPETWTITNSEGFSGGYAAVELVGADGLKYITIIDKTGTQQYEPVKIDSAILPSWHGYVSVVIGGNECILSPKGQVTDINEVNKISTTYTLGTKIVENGYEFTGYGQNINGMKIYTYSSFTDLSGNTISQVLEMEN